MNIISYFSIISLLLSLKVGGYDWSTEETNDEKAQSQNSAITNDVCIEVNTYALTRPTTPGMLRLWSILCCFT
jgi:hypothetical protein